MLRRRFSTVTDASIDSNPFVCGRDAIRLAFTFGSFGTLASYMDILFKNDVVIFKVTVPTPERFMFFSYCWAMAGLASWVILWSRPERILIAATQEFKNYGFHDGFLITALSLSYGVMTIGAMSLWMDWMEYRAAPGVQPIAEPTSLANSTALPNTMAASRGLPVSTPPSSIIDDSSSDDSSSALSKVAFEAGSVEGSSGDSSESSESDSKAKKEKQSGVEISIGHPAIEAMIPGEWDWDRVNAHIYYPCRSFILSNAPLWLCASIPASVVANRIMATRIQIATLTAMNTPAVAGAAAVSASAGGCLALCVDQKSLDAEMQRRSDTYELLLN